LAQFDGRCSRPAGAHLRCHRGGGGVPVVRGRAAHDRPAKRRGVAMGAGGGPQQAERQHDAARARAPQSAIPQPGIVPALAQRSGRFGCTHRECGAQRHGWACPAGILQVGDGLQTRVAGAADPAACRPPSLSDIATTEKLRRQGSSASRHSISAALTSRIAPAVARAARCDGAARLGRWSRARKSRQPSADKMKHRSCGADPCARVAWRSSASTGTACGHMRAAQLPTSHAGPDDRGARTQADSIPGEAPPRCGGPCLQAASQPACSPAGLLRHHLCISVGKPYGDDQRCSMLGGFQKRDSSLGTAAQGRGDLYGQLCLPAALQPGNTCAG
jgi:hypothetical protein